MFWERLACRSVLNTPGQDEMLQGLRKNEKIFEIPDGDAIKLISENGDRYYALCRRIDECHVKIDGVRWHLQAYAQAMEKRGIIFMPAKNNL